MMKCIVMLFSKKVQRHTVLLALEINQCSWNTAEIGWEHADYVLSDQKLIESGEKVKNCIYY